MTRGIRIEPWVHALAAGAAAGTLAEVLVLRLNPEVHQAAEAVLVGLPLWATWFGLGGGLALLVLLVLARGVGGGRGSWPAPGLTALVLLVAATLGWVNADYHDEFLTRTELRMIRQDAVTWLVLALLALVAGAVVRRFGASRRLRVAWAVAFVLLPIGRILLRPTSPRLPAVVVARPLGEPSRPLLVIGVEGLDPTTLLSHAGGGRYRNISRLQLGGTWGPLKPHRPYHRPSLWTTVATGTSPGRHGVKSRWGWRLGWLGDEPLRLLPWTPQGSRLILPWGVADRVEPPPASIPPLWERLRASGVATDAFAWPGKWEASVDLHPEPPPVGRGVLDPTLAESLARALDPFGEQRERVLDAVTRDQLQVDAAVAAIAAGSADTWIFLETLSTVRRHLEPVRKMHTREREVLELTLELLDGQLQRLLDASPGDRLVAVLSPYGLAPPNSWERLRRLLGFGDDWRTSADDCPDGALMLFGDDVPPGGRTAEVRGVDVAPTLCYLLGLPVAQYMEGRVIVEAVSDRYLAQHPLRVVD